jgi:hypothetical protein
MLMRWALVDSQETVSCVPHPFTNVHDVHHVQVIGLALA